MRGILSLKSVWALAAFVTLLLLQVFPIPGILLMMLQAGLACGLLVHVFLFILFSEAVAGRVPRFFMVIPVMAYGAYYSAFGLQMQQMAQSSAELRASKAVS